MQHLTKNPRVMLMTTLMAAVVAAWAALTHAQVATAPDVSQVGCSAATLRGTYAYAGVAFVIGSSPTGGSGMESYDGRGSLKTNDQGSDGVTSFKSSSTGTYTITSNCIATVIYDGDTANPWTYFVATDGSAYYYNNNTNSGRVSGGHSDRISHALLVK